ncbi:hypothetical protein ABZV80_30110 [Streptomyces sp. NPDC005132]|uniref:hypothetical protein n=1 Tax=Streptomyces sp. NPDC005132 TaxID=3154294 RepID=UPI00339FF565
MTVLTVIADAAQEALTELLWQVWPICREHKIGMHPRPAGAADDWRQGETGAVGPPVWWCRDSDWRGFSPVGELAATLPGQLRHALRHNERRRDGR